jgi:hypothetical protein
LTRAGRKRLADAEENWQRIVDVMGRVLRSAERG